MATNYLTSEQWLRLLSGANLDNPSPRKGIVVTQTGQTGKPGGVQAEIIGRTGYPLYNND